MKQQKGIVKIIGSMLIIFLLTSITADASGENTLLQDQLSFMNHSYKEFLISVEGLVSEEDYFHAAVTITSEQATSNKFWLLIFDDENVQVNANRTRVTQTTGVVGYEHFANMTTGLTFPFTDKPANNTDNPYAFRIIIYYEGNVPASMTLIVALQHQALGSHDVLQQQNEQNYNANAQILTIELLSMCAFLIIPVFMSKKRRNE